MKNMKLRKIICLLLVITKVDGKKVTKMASTIMRNRQLLKLPTKYLSAISMLHLLSMPNVQ